MIESITLANTPPFTGAASTLETKSINYIFGANGVGKTTISRILANPGNYLNCSVKWRGQRPLETFVLNRDFVDANFGQMKGIFTLGKEQIGLKEKIASVRDKRETEKNKRDGLLNTLQGTDGNGGKQAELAQLEDEFKETVWNRINPGRSEFKHAFTGFLGSKEAFKNKVLSERNSNQSALKTYEELSKRAKTIFGDRPTVQPLLSNISESKLIAHQDNDILQKAVIGKKDVNIAAMIRKLGNSDWVKQGRAYYEQNNGTCPFCQQHTDATFAASLEAYFDEEYISNMNLIDELIVRYREDAMVIFGKLKTALDTPGQFLDVQALRAQNDLFAQIVRENINHLEDKKKEPSRSIKLESLGDIINAIQNLFDTANSKVREHNRVVENFSSQDKELKAQVWRYIIEELDLDLASYSSKKEALEKAISSIKEKIKICNKTIKEKDDEIRKMEESTTSVRPTVSNINSILQKFGFINFQLQVSNDERSYQLVRMSGEPAAETLSEGEKTFVVFLYFYNLLRGSLDATGINVDRIVVFDDPVSSLDSNVLFIVSTLIRNICEDVYKNEGSIKQVFVLTHNVYFHRELTYQGHSAVIRPVAQAFAIIRKVKSVSHIITYNENPIKTTYELLWREVRYASSDNTGLANTMRRILEYYFKVIGGKSTDELLEVFDGNDKMLCRSLLSWVNAGSHHIFEPDLHVPSDTEISTYQRVFQEIFQKHGHGAHYQMMMGEDSFQAAQNDSIPESAEITP